MKSNQTELWPSKWPTSALEPKGSSHNKNGSQNMLKLGLPSTTCWTGSQLVQPIEKNYETLPTDSSKNKESKKKWRSILSPNERELAETIQCVYKTGLPSKTCWTDSQPVQPIEKISETLPTDSLKNKKSKKKNSTQFRARMRENWPKQCNIFIFHFNNGDKWVGWSCRGA